MQPMRFFNTAGPMKPDIHYTIPPLERLDAEQVRSLIRQQKYFVLHAPRQTGKTSALLALQDELNASGQYRCVYVNVEVGQSRTGGRGRGDAGHAERAVTGGGIRPGRPVRETAFGGRFLDKSGPHDALRRIC